MELSMVFHGFSPCFYSCRSSPVGPSPYREGPQLFSANPEVATSSISSDTSSAVLEGLDVVQIRMILIWKIWLIRYKHSLIVVNKRNHPQHSLISG